MKSSIHSNTISMSEITSLVNQRDGGIEFSQDVLERVAQSRKNFDKYFEKKIPIYGVTTGFGDSCHRSVRSEDSELLQDNLVSYLLMGTGKVLTEEVSRSVLLFRIISLSRGFSGVTVSLLEKMKELYNKGIYPVIPREGSLGASGDLIPLAYLANNLRGSGSVYFKGEICEMEDLVKEGIYTPYTLKAKEGLALVNGTTTMTAQSFHNFKLAKFINDLSMLATGWLCLTIQGRKEAFGEIVNDLAKSFSGQSFAAKNIRKILEEEGYTTVSYKDISKADDHQTTHLVQDPYSLRCAPQVIGPVVDTLNVMQGWLETEINGVSDNPLFDQEDSIANGGNFYGGYLAHSMDYLKICMANIADLMDRQLTLLISEKTNRGLTPNLANWENLKPEERHLSHGLKALHQNVSAITSDVMAKAMPNSIFSRSSESHNQDKVSLGMTAAVQASEQLEVMVTVMSCYLTCLAQAIDLRKIKLKGTESNYFYNLVRKNVSFASKDQRMDLSILKLREALINEAREKGHVFL